MMINYTDFGTYIYRVDDQGTISFIPKDSNNFDYKLYEDWVMSGNIAPIGNPPEPTLDDIKTDLKSQAEEYLLKKLDYGFIFQEHRYPADVQAQTSVINQWDWYNDTDPRNELLLGFKSKDASWIPMDEPTFKEFQTAGRIFVMGLYQSIWNLKENLIPNAITAEEAQNALINWENQ